MMKRILSFLLCLIMVLGLAAPSVQASDDGVYTSDNIMDNVYIENGSDANIVIDGEPVNDSQDIKLPNPADLVTEPTEPPYLVGAPVEEEPATEVGCECADLASAVKHSGVCLVKAPYMELCGNASAEELYAQWGNYTLVEQDFILDYLYEAFPQKSNDLQKLLSAPTGSASETYVDGTTVSVEGIPQDGSLTVGDADAVKDIVDTYVAEQEMLVSPLFSYDVSVQDGEGADWQPEVNVKMELELPGEKLHKNTKVFVVHVDDNGVATTIEAEVTEDGKIAFETPSFSAFYGFTVDFDYEGATFSINGMSNIKLSELFANLNMPLNASDVVNVEYTDYTQIQIDQLEGDWLLTSLKAFDTEEKLTLTMNDGTVYQVKVTDDDGYAAVYLGGSTSINYDKGSSGTGTANGQITWNANTSGGNLNATGWDRRKQVEVRGPGTMIINIQNEDGYTDETLYVDLLQLKITNGAKVKLRAGGHFVDSNKRVCIRSSAHAVGYQNWGMIWVQNGSLEIVGRDVDGIDVDLVFGGRDDWKYPKREDIDTGKKYSQHPLILLGSGATELNVQYAEFMHSSSGAIGNQDGVVPSALTSMTLSNCTFYKSVYNETGLSGGAVQMKTTGTATSFSATNCTFNGQTCNNRGGAVSIDNSIGSVTFNTCSFTDVSSTNSHGGAVAIGMLTTSFNVGTISVTNCTFKNTQSKGVGGAIGITDGDYESIEVKNTTFEQCRTPGFGGGLGVKRSAESNVTDVTVTGDLLIQDCTFKNCHGGALQPAGYTDTASTVPVTWDHDGNPASPEIDKLNGVSGGGAICLGGTYQYVEIVGNETKDMLIQNCTSLNNGGGIFFNSGMKVTGKEVDGKKVAVRLQYLDIDKCFARDAGNAIYLTVDQIDPLNLSDSTVHNCDSFDVALAANQENLNAVLTANQVFDDRNFGLPGKATAEQQQQLLARWKNEYTPQDLCKAYDAGGTIRTVGNAAVAAYIDSCDIQYNGSYSNGGGVYWNANKVVKDADGNVILTPKIVISNTDFIGNRAVGSGGGVYCEAAMEVLSCNFTLNEAVGKGGAISQGTYNNADRQLGESGGNETNNLKLGTVEGLTNEDGTPKVTKIYNNTATYGGGISITVNGTDSYPHDLKPEFDPEKTSVDTTTDEYKEAIKKPANWDFHTDFTYEFKFELGGAHVYENKATMDGGGIYYSAAYYGDLTGTDSVGVSYEERQRQVDSFKKDITINNGLIYGNIAGKNVLTHAVKVTDASTLKAGDQLIIAAKDDDFALSTNQPSTYRTQAGITKDDSGYVVVTSETEVFTLVTNSSYTDAFGLMATDGKYLTSFTTATNKIQTSSTLNANSSWKIVIDGTTGAATVSSKLANGGSNRNRLRYHSGNNYYGIYTYSNGGTNGELEEDFGVFRLVSDIENGKLAELVTDASTLKAGDQIVIATLEQFLSMSKTANGNGYRKHKVLSRQTEKVLTFSDSAGVEELTLEVGTLDGTYALKTHDNKYLATGTATEGDQNYLLTADAKSEVASWDITIHPVTGLAYMVARGTGSYKHLRFNADADWFKCYGSGSNESYVSIYKVTQTVSGGKLAKLVTSTSNLRQGDKIIIVAMLADEALGTAAGDNGIARMEAHVTKYDRTSFGEDVQVVTLAEKAAYPGTFLFMTSDTESLRCASTADQMKTDNYLTGNAAFTVTIDPSTGAATITDEAYCWQNNDKSTGVMVRQLAYNPTEGRFSFYAAGAQSEIVLYRLEQLEVGESGNGGGLYMNSNQSQSVNGGYSKLSITGGSIYKNTAYFGNGGGIYLQGENALCTITGDTTGIGTVCTKSGSTVSLSPDNGNTATGIRVSANNYYGGNGGGIAIFGGARIEMTGGYVYGNLSETAGGGIAVHGGYTKKVNNKDVFFSSTMMLTDGYVDNNVSSMGGGISLNGAKGTGNAADVNTQYGMYFNGGNVCQNKVIPNADGIAYGGGICLAGTNGATMKIADGVISGNTAATTTAGTSFAANQEGGGIAVCQASEMTITGGRITSNKAYDGGGMVVRGASKVDMDGTLVLYTKAEADADAALPDGDANKKGITEGDVKLELSSGVIAGNTVQHHGGGVYMPNSTGTNTFKLEDGCINANTSVGGGNGGGAYVGTGNSFTLDGGHIDDNSANDGGGLNVYKATVTINDGYLLRNKVKRNGGAIYSDYSAVTVTGGYFKYNSTDGSGQSDPGHGGAIFSYGTPSSGASTVTITGGEFHNNTAVKTGGAVSVKGTAGSFSVSNATFMNNYSGTNAGALYCSAPSLTVESGTFTSNTAGNYGGAVMTENSCTFTINGGTFTSNGAGAYGGAVFTSTGTAKITTGTFTNNTAVNSGGAVYTTEGSFEISGGTFTSNSASRKGGAVRTYNGTFTLSNGTFNNNSAKLDGGAFHAQFGSLSITGGDFNGNVSSEGCGGGMYIEECDTTISNGTFNNNAGVFGGGMYIIDTGNVSFTGGSFTYNKSNQGAGIFIRTSTVTIANVTVSYNIAGTDDRYTNYSSKFGGGLYVDAYGTSTVTVNSGNFTFNEAPYGGGIYVGNRQNNSNNVVTLNMNGGTVSNNKATTDGGGIYVNGGGIVGTTTVTEGIPTFSGCTSVIMTGGEVFKNSADVGCGGGIYATSAGKVSIQGTSDRVGEISENTAKNGGGVYVIDGAELYVHNGQIIKNTAVGDSGQGTAYGIDPGLLSGVGGGIYVTSGSDTAASKFVLSGEDMAIYGNTATFAADDVFSNGNNTKLDVPKVTQMNLVGYGFNPEGWVEDYATYDSNYADFGTNMIGVYGKNDGSVSVLRYRNASATVRRYMLIKPEYVTGDGVSGVYANKDDAYVCMTLGIPTAMDDTVVVDYGKQTVISAWMNDLFLDADTSDGGDNDFAHENVAIDAGTYLGHSFTTGTEDGNVKKYEDTCYFQIVEDTLPPYVVGTRTGIYGAAGIVYSVGDGTFSYNTRNMKMSKEDSFFYATAHNGYWYYAKMNVVPATTIYYEDNASLGANLFVNYHTEADHEQLATWTKELGGTMEGYTQEEDRPGDAILDGLDADNIYGYDSSYSESTGFSRGSAMKVSVTRHALVDTNNDGKCDECDITYTHTFVGSGNLCSRCYNDQASHSNNTAHTCSDDRYYNGYCNTCSKYISHTANARATFTFTGTGFDIISYCSASTGAVTVSIWEGTGENIQYEDNPATPEYEITTPIATFAADTNYTRTDTGDLYQVPVIKVDLTQTKKYNADWSWTEGNYYGYGTYTVEIYVAPGWVGSPTRNGGDFYLDAIRIYNPAGINGGNNQTVTDAYLADGEGWPVYAELRNHILDKYDLESDDANKSVAGILFIDGVTGDKGATLGDYASWGPNNELYCRGTGTSGGAQGITFNLNMTKYALTGKEIDRVHIAMRSLSGTGTVEIYNVENTSKTLWKTIDLGTTDMYYDITELLGGKVAIMNSGSANIAISTLKVTHKQPTPSDFSLTPLLTGEARDLKAGIEILNVEQLAKPTVTPKYPALSFNGMVCYNVFFSAEDLGDLTADDLGLAVFNTYAPEGTVENANEVYLGATEIDGLYMIATDGVNAKYLGNTKFFRAFVKQADGTYIYSKMVSYSAKDYAMNVLAQSDDVKLKQLAVAMLNYGAEAQKFFGYKTYDLMNKDLTADDQALLAGYDASSLKGLVKADDSKIGVFGYNGGFASRRPAISFKGAFEINYFMTPANAVDGDMTMYFWSEDTYNNVTELTAENADKAVVMTLENGTYTACSDEIFARRLDETVYVAAVYESDGVTYCTGVLAYSIAAYCQNPPAGVQDLANAAAIYGCAAKEFFGA